MYDFESMLSELGAAPKKKAKAKPKPKAAPKAKKAPKPVRAKKAPKPVKARPAPKPKKAAKPPKATKAAKPKKAPKPAKPKPAPKAAKPRPAPKAAKAAPKAAKPAPKARTAPSRPARAASVLVRRSGSTSLALVPTSLRTPEPAERETFAPEPDSPEYLDSPDSSESPDSYDSSESDDYQEESEDYPEEEDTSDDQEPEEPEEEESGDEEEPSDYEVGTLQVTEAVEMRPDGATSRMLDNIHQTAKPLSSRLRGKDLSKGEIDKHANGVIAHACRCHGLTPEHVRARLNQRLTRRGYPPGSSDKMLAEIGLIQEDVEKAASARAAQSGGVLSKLHSLASKLPTNHPTKVRAMRLLLTLEPV